MRRLGGATVVTPRLASGESVPAATTMARSIGAEGSGVGVGIGGWGVGGWGTGSGTGTNSLVTAQPFFGLLRVSVTEAPPPAVATGVPLQMAAARRQLPGTGPGDGVISRIR